MREFYNRDCMEGMKEYPDKYFDLAIVDPPYGINIGRQGMGVGGGVSPQTNRSAANINRGGSRSEAPSPSEVRIGGGITEAKIYKAFDDSTIPDEEYFDELARVSKRAIIWGGNYFLDNLGATECMIVWDKKRRGINFADCELAWTNIKEPCRVFEFQWNGMLQEDMKNKEERIHPTQKPVRLYTWLLINFANKGDKILDTHVGSGSSLVACERLGFDYVGFEIDKDYYKAALERIEEERQQIKWELKLP